MSRDVSHRCGSDPALLWLWCRPVASALIGSLAQEPPYAAGVALKKDQKKKSVTLGHRETVIQYKYMHHIIFVITDKIQEYVVLRILRLGLWL